MVEAALHIVRTSDEARAARDKGGGETVSRSELFNLSNRKAKVCSLGVDLGIKAKLGAHELGAHN